MAATKDSYAIISLGGKQYRVREGERLLVDRLKTDEGKTFNPDVLFLGGDGDGTLSPQTQVTVKVVGHVLGDKIRIGKRRPKSGYRKQTGFRASLSQIEIQSIGGTAKRATAAATPAAEKETPAPKPKAETPAAATRSGSSRGACSGVAAPWLRGLHGRRHLREVQALEGRAAGGRTEVREEERKAEGRDRSTRVRARSEAGEELMAHKKGLGSSRNGRDSNPKMLGVKVFSGQEVKAGMIILRQRGTKFRPGDGTGIGRDDTIFAKRPGTVAFRQSGERRFVEVSDSQKS